MENSVKALYIAAGMLFGIMILSVWVYIFRQGASLGQFYEADRNTERIQAFNSQFEKYDLSTIQRKASYGYSFEEKGNTASDVITCANLVYNINKKNDFDEKNCVDLTVKIGTSKQYHVYAVDNQPKEYFFIDHTKSFYISARHMTWFQPSDPSFNTFCKSFNDFLQEYNKVKIVNINVPSPHQDMSTSAETIYKYYFDVDKDESGASGKGIQYSEITGKVNKIVFTLNETEEFDSLGAGNWTENI